MAAKPYLVKECFGSTQRSPNWLEVPDHTYTLVIADQYVNCCVNEASTKALHALGAHVKHLAVIAQARLAKIAHESRGDDCQKNAQQVDGKCEVAVDLDECGGKYNEEGYGQGTLPRGD